MIKIKKIKSFTNYSIFIVSVLISIYSLYYFISNKIYFIGSDAYYYWSIADSFLTHGVLMDITIVPNGFLRTPHIGMVFIHLFSSLINIQSEDRFIFISILYYLLHISSLYPINQIAKRLGIKDLFSRLLIISAHLGAWHLYRAQLLSNNDGFFNPLAIWFIYILFIIAQNISKQKLSTLIKNRDNYLWIIITASLLSYILPLFRLQVILIHLSAIFTALIIKNYTLLRYSITLLLASTLSLIISFANTNTETITNKVISKSSSIMFDIFGEIYRTIFDKIPSLFYNYNLDNFIDYLAIIPLGVLLYLFYKSLIEKNFSLLFLTTICCSALLWATVFGYSRARYFLYIYPMFFSILFVSDKKRFIGYFFVCLVLVSSFYNLIRPYDRPPASRITLYLHNNNIVLPNKNPLLISSFERHPYFFLKSSTFAGKLDINIILDNGEIFLLGDEKYLNNKIAMISRLAESNSYTFNSTSLIPDYDESLIEKRFSIRELFGISVGKQRYQKSGYDLIHLYNFIKK